MENHNHKIPFELDFEIGELELDVDYEIIPAYYGTKVDDIKDFNSTELKDFQINEAVFIDDDGKRKELTKEEIADNYDKIRDYFVENIEKFMD